MWKLKTIEAENLCAFRSLSYTLRQGVTTLIFGDNRDNDSQQSNGAGKSAYLGRSYFYLRSWRTDSFHTIRKEHSFGG